MVVMDDADLDLAVEGALFGGFGTAGQRCTSLGTAIVHESVHDEFVRRLDERLRAAAIGDPTQDVLYGPMLHERFAERFEDWLGLIRDHHTVARLDRRRPDHRRRTPRDGFVGDPDAGIFYHPTIVDRRHGSTTTCTATETFGPIIGVARFETFDEAMELANGHGYGLSSAIYTTLAHARLPLPRARSAPAWCRVNNSTSGAEAHLPFGGNGKSGNGSRQSGIWVLDQFTRWQSMNWDYAGKLQKAQMDVIGDRRRHGASGSRRASAEARRHRPARDRRLPPRPRRLARSGAAAAARGSRCPRAEVVDCNVVWASFPNIKIARRAT